MELLTRDHLSRLPSRPLSPGRNRTKADVFLVEWNSAQVVVKDFRPRGLLVRNTIGRFSVSRECRACARLGGLAGIPRLVGRIDPHAFAYAFVPGNPLPSVAKRSLPVCFFTSLEQLLTAIHGRGVALTDLHHRNVIIGGPSGSPVLIDFSLALLRPAKWNLPGRWLFQRAQELDRIALARIRQRYESRGQTAGSADPAAPAEPPGGREGPPGTRSAPASIGRATGRSGPFGPPRSGLYQLGRALKRALRIVRRKKP